MVSGYNPTYQPADWGGSQARRRKNLPGVTGLNTPPAGAGADRLGYPTPPHQQAGQPPGGMDLRLLSLMGDYQKQLGQSPRYATPGTPLQSSLAHTNAQQQGGAGVGSMNAGGELAQPRVGPYDDMARQRRISAMMAPQEPWGGSSIWGGDQAPANIAQGYGAMQRLGITPGSDKLSQIAGADSPNDLTGRLREMEPRVRQSLDRTNPMQEGETRDQYAARIQQEYSLDPATGMAKKTFYMPSDVPQEEMDQRRAEYKARLADQQAGQQGLPPEIRQQMQVARAQDRRISPARAKYESMLQAMGGDIGQGGGAGEIPDVLRREFDRTFNPQQEFENDMAKQRLAMDGQAGKLARDQFAAETDPRNMAMGIATELAGQGLITPMQLPQYVNHFSQGGAGGTAANPTQAGLPGNQRATALPPVPPDMANAAYELHPNDSQQALQQLMGQGYPEQAAAGALSSAYTLSPGRKNFERFAETQIPSIMNAGHTIRQLMGGEMFKPNHVGIEPPAGLVYEAQRGNPKAQAILDDHYAMLRRLGLEQPAPQQEQEGGAIKRFLTGLMGGAVR